MARLSRFPVIAVLAAFAVVGCSSEDPIESVMEIDVPGTADATETADTNATDSPTTTDAAAEETQTTTVGEDDDPNTTLGDDSPATTASGPAGDDICVPLRVLSDYDVASSELIATADWSKIQSFFVDSTPPVLDAYDEAIALDTELSDELETLKAITEGTSDMAAEADDLEELGLGLIGLPGIMEAGVAALTLNTFAVDNCGFSTGGN